MKEGRRRKKDGWGWEGDWPEKTEPVTIKGKGTVVC